MARRPISREQRLPRPQRRVAHRRALESAKPMSTETEAHAAALLERRRRLLGPAYRLFYSQPLELVRGEGVHLYDAAGEEYLDAYNNVPCVGHAHPRVVAAIAEQA